MRNTRPRTARTSMAVMCSMLGLMIAAGCGQRPTRLTNTSKSPEEVCQKVIDALSRNDAAGLDQLRLTRFEHDSVLGSQMPAPPPGVDRDMNMAWFFLDQNSIKGIRRAVADYGGQRMSFVSVRFTKTEERFGYLVAHKGTEVTVRDSTGAEVVLPIFGSILEDNGHFKLVSLRD